jgi:SAM-dependent methyltransferase
VNQNTAPKLPRPPVHTPDWTPEQIAAFWDNYGSIPHFRQRFFSLSWGVGILAIAEKFMPRDGVILDYGCGRGDLMQPMIDGGHRVMGCDASPDSVRTVAERFAGKPNFLGAFVPSDAAKPADADVVTLVEVIEHLPPPAVPGLLAALAAHLKPGGHVIITCPHKENLQAAEVLCPECACRFHPVQHLQSLAPADVAAVAEAAGFRTMFARATRLRRKGESALLSAIIAAGARLVAQAPHLVYVGQKPAARP